MAADQDPQTEKADGPAKPEATANESGKSAFDFPVVGVGASAGALDAYRKFLAGMPKDPGVALVFVQHLDPTHKSMMADLLGRHSPLPVVEATDGIKIEPGHVYLTPPNTYLRLTPQGLSLDPPSDQGGARMAIDYFFRSLAETQREKAICIVLSGTGGDGTQGLKEVKAAGGMAMVQRPASAEYDGMPRSAVATGMADFVLDVESLPGALIDFVNHPYLRNTTSPPRLSQAQPGLFRTILNLLLAHTDYDFSFYKHGTLERRIQRRMGLRRLVEARDYVALLREESDELRALASDLLIGVTRFFRDPQVWDQLRKTVIRPLIAGKSDGDRVRVWVPGCASGEEAYTLAMLLFEEMDAQERSLRIQIYATDLDKAVLEKARAGSYSRSIAEDLSPERLEAFFTENGDEFVVSKRIREATIFAVHNVISDPPFSRLDLISCRNLMIYLDRSVQRRVLELFHFALVEGGMLLLGTSESADHAGTLFDPVSGSLRLYRRKFGPRSASLPIRVGQAGPDAGPGTRGRIPGRPVGEMAERLLAETFAPPSVLVNERFEPQYFHGPLRDYLELPAGDRPLEIWRFAVSGLSHKLRVLLERAARENAATEGIVHNVERDDHKMAIRIEVRPVHPPQGGETRYLVSFFDQSEAQAKLPAHQPEDERTAYQQLEEELRATQHDLQSTIEDLETANQELSAAHEEAMSMNEEFQSTNEELETSREELQSLNEELTTVNSQLEDTVEELRQTNSDLANLLVSTEIATVFLDPDLRIRRFTPAAQRLLNFIEGDLRRPITDLSLPVTDPALIDDARAVLNDLQAREAEVQDDRGRSYIRSIQPYRLSEGKIGGVVITLTDVTRLRDAVSRLGRRERQQAAVADLGQQALAGSDIDSLLVDAAGTVARLLDCQLTGVLELDRGADSFVLRAGHGWPDGTIGTRIPSGTSSQAGYTVANAGPVIVEDLETEQRFSTHSVLRDNGGVSGISVIIGKPSSPWGVLGAYATRKRGFSPDDVSFVQSVANLINSMIVEKDIQKERDALILRLERVLAATEISAWEWDPNTDTAMWDVRMNRLTGLPDDAPMTSGSFFEAVHPDDRDRVQAALDRMVETGSEYNEEFRVVWPDGTVRWLAGMGSRLKDSAGGHRIFGVNFDITRRVTADRLLSESEERRELALEAANLGTWQWVPDEKHMIWDERMFRLTGMSPRETVPVSEFARYVHPDDWERRNRSIRQALASDSSFQNSYRFYRDGEELWFTSTGRVFEGPAGPRVYGITADTTAAKREEERSRMLMAELDHRVKNILANVNAIARHTHHSRSNPEEFIEALEGRLSAMADAHSLLSESHWKGVSLLALIEAELAPYVSEPENRVEIMGEDRLLSPKAAQTMSLFLHELATNAAKHGALTEPDCRLSIRWAVSDGMVDFRWSERCTFEITPPERRGFGRSVIEDMTASDLNGEVHLEFRQDGLQCRLLAPLEYVSATGRAAIVPDLRGLPGRQDDDASPGTNTGPPLKILIVEDIWTVAMHLKALLEEEGHEVVGPGGRLEEAEALAEIEDLDAAILDVRLDEELVFPVAERLAERGVPFGFATGYADTNVVPKTFSDRPLLSKPYRRSSVVAMLQNLANGSGRAATD